MNLCTVSFEGSTYAYSVNSMTQERYWVCTERGTGSGTPNMIVHFNLAQQLREQALKDGIDAKTFAPPVKKKAVSGGRGEPRVKTKISLASLFDSADKDNIEEGED